MAKRPSPKRPAARGAAGALTRSGPAGSGLNLTWTFLVLAFAASLASIIIWYPALIAAVLNGLATFVIGVGALWSIGLAGLAGLVGLAPPVLIVGLLPAGWWLTRRPWPVDRLIRGWVALGLAAILIYTGFGAIRPSGLSLAGVPLDEVSAGGSIGRALAGEAWWETVLRVAILILAGAAVAAPRPSLAAARWLARQTWLGWRRGIELTWRGIARTGAAVAGWWRARRIARAARPAIARVGAVPSPAPAPAPSPLPEEVLPVATAPAVAPARKPAPAKAEPALPAARPGPPPALPPLDLLDDAPLTEISRSDIQERVALIEETLAAYGVNAKVVQVSEGPTVTQFGVEPGWDIKHREVKERDAGGRVKVDKDGQPKVRLEEVSRTRVKVNRITALANDLALALAAPTIRIEAPVPGKPVIGIEVPNRTYSLVTLRSVIESATFQKMAAKSKLPLALGQNVAGDPVAADLAKMPHLLIAGSTGSGKSVCLNSIIASILTQATPAEVRLLMIDPKRVELVPYNGIPHLLSPVITDADKVVGVLGWVVKDMDTRYRTFEEAGARNIEGYNKKMVERNLPPLPYEVVIIDELADLMMVAADEVERQLCRLAQLARATGIHLIVATQRPSVDVLTGLIKANFPTRISFAVSSQVDSRTILDAVGAEKLLGRGDMLFLASDAPKPVRVQGNYVSDREIDAIVEFWKNTGPPRYIPEIEEAMNRAAEDEPDALFEEARRLVEQHPRISVSFLQRKLRIGYNRAARLMDQLDDAGLIDDPAGGRGSDDLAGVGSGSPF